MGRLGFSDQSRMGVTSSERNFEGTDCCRVRNHPMLIVAPYGSALPSLSLGSTPPTTLNRLLPQSLIRLACFQSLIHLLGTLSPPSYHKSDSTSFSLHLVGMKLLPVEDDDLRPHHYDNMLYHSSDATDSICELRPLDSLLLWHSYVIHIRFWIQPHAGSTLRLALLIRTTLNSTNPSFKAWFRRTTGRGIDGFQFQCDFDSAFRILVQTVR
jgi:hypothetical protein